MVCPPFHSVIKHLMENLGLSGKMRILAPEKPPLETWIEDVEIEYEIFTEEI